jgi:hypothetical protein
MWRAYPHRTSLVLVASHHDHKAGLYLRCPLEQLLGASKFFGVVGLSNDGWKEQKRDRGLSVIRADIGVECIKNVEHVYSRLFTLLLCCFWCGSEEDFFNSPHSVAGPTSVSSSMLYALAL